MNTYWVNADGSVRVSNLRDWEDDWIIEEYDTLKMDVKFDDIFAVAGGDALWREEYSPNKFGRGSGTLNPPAYVRDKKKNAA